MNPRLLKLCQWDFIEYANAVIFGTAPDNLPVTRQLAGIGRVHGGFYSWLPRNTDDLAIVLQHKTKPKPYTTYQPPNGSQADAICSLTECLLRNQGYLVGISCISPDTYRAMFAGSAKCLTFLINPDTLKQITSVETLTNHLDNIASQLINQINEPTRNV